MKTQIVIVAGGLGTRLGQITENLPKSLVRISGKPFIEYQIENLMTKGFNNILLCLGHFGEQIEEYCGNGDKFGVSLKYHYEKKQSGTAGALKLAEPLIEDIFFTLYGDSYVFIDFQDMLDSFLRKNMLASLAVYKNNNNFDVSNTEIERGLVKKYCKNKPEEFSYIDYGVNLFRKDVLHMIPADQSYSMEDLFGQLIKCQNLMAYEVKNRFYEIGSINGLNEFTNYIGERK